MSSNANKAIVLIPIYKSYFDDFEIKSLQSVSKNLSDFTIAFIAPKALNCDFIHNYNLGFKYLTVRFEDDFFKSIEGYNKLLLSSHFYESFLEYDYMLICQTDAFVFKNQLNWWVDKGYDYIGAPWLDSENKVFSHKPRSIFNKIKKVIGLHQKLYTHINQVGNGGFSLRKTKTFFDISLKEKSQINYFLSHKEKENYHIEDVFWSLYVPTKHTFLKPDYKTALHFCVDRKPEIAFNYLKGNLPFACHGFNKKGVVKFWTKYL